ncbi:MAG: hypothetical protein NT076_01375 [Candidatus Pacearchaeota archaeon]|nr:hypothetical protein [Candidatus Pacearchaeota archaeon]
MKLQIIEGLGGAHCFVDALEIGTPAVVWEGDFCEVYTAGKGRIDEIIRKSKTKEIGIRTFCPDGPEDMKAYIEGLGKIYLETPKNWEVYGGMPQEQVMGMEAELQQLQEKAYSLEQKLRDASNTGKKKFTEELEQTLE